MSFSNDSKQKLIAVAAVIIVALLGVNAYLWYDKFNQKQVLEQTSQELDEAEKLNTELEKQYYEALAELEEMRGNNEELNALIDQQKTELGESKEKIAQMIRSGKASKSELSKARSEIAQMRTQLDGYVAEINALKEEKDILTAENSQLTQERDHLSNEVVTTKTMNEELVTARAALVSEKENLLEEKSKLTKKVNIASVIKVNSIDVTPEKIRKSGKAVKKSRANAADRLKICFDASENQVTDAGVEQFFVRLINPLGETIAVEDMGSGVMVSQVNEEEIRFTQMKELEYNNEEMQACFFWTPTASFAEGTYDIEIYNKGYLAGKDKFTLK